MRPALDYSREAKEAAAAAGVTQDQASRVLQALARRNFALALSGKPIPALGVGIATVRFLQLPGTNSAVRGNVRLSKKLREAIRANAGYPRGEWNGWTREPMREAA